MVPKKMFISYKAMFEIILKTMPAKLHQGILEYKKIHQTNGSPLLTDPESPSEINKALAEIEKLQEEYNKIHGPVLDISSIKLEKIKRPTSKKKKKQSGLGPLIGQKRTHEEPNPIRKKSNNKIKRRKLNEDLEDILKLLDTLAINHPNLPHINEIQNLIGSLKL